MRLNTVCFGLRGVNDTTVVANFLQKLNATGQVFMMPTRYQGTLGMRAALVNWHTSDEDIALVTQVMLEALSGTSSSQRDEITRTFT